MKIMLLFLFFLIPQVASSQINLVIKANAPFIKDGTKVLIERVRPRRFSDLKHEVDSAVVKDHQFGFKLRDDNGEFYFVTINKHNTRLFLQPGSANVTLADSLLNNVSVSGNLMAEEYEQFFKRVINDSIRQLASKASRDYYNYAKIKDRNLDTLKAKGQKMEELTKLDDSRYVKFCLNWIQQHPNSYLNCYLLYSTFNPEKYSISEDEVKHIFAEMPANLTDNVWGRELKYRIDSLFVGAKAPDFAQADTNGKVVKLSNFRGQYVLVDFWASWCVPCRAENPNVVKAAQQFANRNFRVLGISLDQKKELWLQAIQKDGLYWTQLSDLGLWRNAVSVKYYVYEIPANYLIGPDGTILAKNLEGDELLSTLKKAIQ